MSAHTPSAEAQWLADHYLAKLALSPPDIIAVCDAILLIAERCLDEADHAWFLEHTA